MDDLIRRQDAINEIESWYDDFDEYDENRGLTKAVSVIRDLPSVEPEQKWIPVSERMPEDRVDVLLCYREHNYLYERYVYTIVNGWHAHKYSVKKDEFCYWEDDTDYNEEEDEFYIQEGWYEFTTQGNSDLMNWYINAEVVAWMPLPEPYQKEGEER